MWNPRLLNLLAALLLLPSLGWAALQPLPPGETRWSGEVRLEQALEVPPGATLRVAAGTRIRVADPAARLLVRGGLEIAGSAARPVVFVAPQDWLGLELLEPEAPVVIRHARFSGAKSAVQALGARLRVEHSEFRGGGHGIELVRDSLADVTDCLFEGNEVGLEAQMKSRIQLQRSRFRKHVGSAFLAGHGSSGAIEDCRFEDNRQAIGLKGRFEGRIAGNRFTDNHTAIFCNQTQRSPLIRANHFEGGEIALANLSFSFPLVEDNRFLRNGTALRNDQFGSAQVRRNLFADNGTALWNNRKSDPLVENNIFKNNERALFCDYSSYPRVRRNNFSGNRLAVELGRFQSADFEKRMGSKGFALDQAQERRSQNPLLARAPTEFTDLVDVRDNWWGADTERLVAAGEEGVPDLFIDRHQLGRVRYEGWGEDSYLVDRVVFAPWLEQAVADAGPQEAP
ncbi:right-handed parallel beta-helix repeat-containing protein [Geoalkalibacter sp.]|uniref:right-handed parallel beta-helix repeat-containing protein n=1 Tax=Geoalkalibacter sp. TaxID=3041440 RepID=UPI00272ECFC1|nr:right-handed parallel beta-helix repeat-containing protein [Geoalkalibacter sp.]